MLDLDDLVMSMKQAAVEAVGATKPAEFLFGEVISGSPLKIMVEQKLTLTAAQLILLRDVTEYTLDMTVNHVTEPAGVTLSEGQTSHSHGIPAHTTQSAEVPHAHAYQGAAAAAETGGATPSTAHTHDVAENTTEGGGFSCNNSGTHVHGYVGRKTFLVHNALVAGEEVLLMRMQGGQNYLVIDRVVTAV